MKGSRFEKKNHTENNVEHPDKQYDTKMQQYISICSYFSLNILKRRNQIFENGHPDLV